MAFVVSQVSVTWPGASRRVAEAEKRTMLGGVGTVVLGCCTRQPLTKTKPRANTASARRLEFMECMAFTGA